MESFPAGQIMSRLSLGQAYLNAVCISFGELRTTRGLRVFDGSHTTLIPNLCLSSESKVPYEDGHSSTSLP